MSKNQTIETNQYLTFTLGEEEFALEISRVHEVVDYTHITRVPRMPSHLCGVINLRGNVVSVIDLRLKLGMSAIEKGTYTCIVIMEVNMDGEMLHIGALVDSVHEVIHLYPDQIEPPPKVGIKLHPEFIRGVGKRNDSFLIILNIDKVLSRDESRKPRNPNETSDHETEDFRES